MKLDENQNTKTCFKKEGVVNPTNAAEVGKMTLLVSPGLDRVEVIFDQDKSSSSGRRNISEVQKWSGQLPKEG